MDTKWIQKRLPSKVNASEEDAILKAMSEDKVESRLIRVFPDGSMVSSKIDPNGNEIKGTKSKF